MVAALLLTLPLVTACEEVRRFEDSLFDIGGRKEIVAADPEGPLTQLEAEKAVAPPGEEALKPEGNAAPSESAGKALTEPELYGASGGVGDLKPPGGVGLSVATGGAVSLNFVEADILEVVDVVLGETLGLNYVVDSRVQGSVTARTTRPISRESLFAALENILALNGATLSRVGEVYNVVPLQEGAGAVSRPVVGPRDRAGAQGFAIHLIPLNYVAASSLQEVLGRFVAPGRVLVVDDARNLVIFAGGSQEARDLSDLIETFDVDWLAGMSFALIPVNVADVDTMVSELDSVFGQDQEGPLSGVVRFLPIERLHAVLVISSQEAYLERAQVWVKRLDRGSEAAGRTIFVYYVKNARAVDLADILNQVFSASGGSGRDEARRDVAPGLRPVEIVGDDYDALAPGGESAGGDEDGTQPRTQRQTNRQGDINSGSRNLDVAERTGEAIGVGSLVNESGDIRVIADERNNALVVLATPSEFRMIEATLKRLDILPLQVLIEATIAEVTLNDELRFGLQWFFERGNFQSSLTSVSSGIVGQTFPGFNLFFSSNDVTVALDALAEITDVKVISSPQLMVLDNQSARLQVGDQVPVATQSAVSVVDNEAPIVNSIELKDTGVILEVTPHVNASGLVMLDIIQEVSDVDETTTSDIDSPTINQRRVESTVAVQSGETVVLGGLIQDRDQTGESGVPGLKDIPLLGLLFKSRSDIVSRTELLILITPRVVRDQNEAREVTRELRLRLRGLGSFEEKIN